MGGPRRVYRQRVQFLFPDNRFYVLIIGGGWGGMLYAMWNIEAGIKDSSLSSLNKQQTLPYQANLFI
jgi:hypothetical protein